jgi:HlyD family secretion protein
VPAVPSNEPNGQRPTLQPPAEGAEMGNGRGRVGLVFVPDSAGYAPRVVRLGVSDYDYSEVLSGVAEGDSVALLAAATMQVRRDQQNEQMRSRMGGVPGMQRQTPAAGGTGGTGGARGGGR